MADTDKTDPGIIDKAKAANAAADPKVDGVLARVMASKWSPVIIGAVLIATFLAGVWAAWPKK